ncbi:hypothetical protein SVIRM249S_06906 [Streptomyces viridochromogenes]
MTEVGCAGGAQVGQLTSTPGRWLRQEGAHPPGGQVVTEGFLRDDLPAGWVSALLPQLMHLVSRQLPDLSPARAADLVVDTLLRGAGVP